MKGVVWYEDKIRGEEYEITYDKTGKKYSKGVGLVITKKSL